MLIAILVLSALSLGVNATFVSFLIWAFTDNQKDNREAQKRASQKKDNE